MLNLSSVELEDVTHGVKMPSSEFKPTATEAELAAARAVLQSLLVFLKDRPTMPAQYITTFLRVALEEGMGVTEYAQMAHVAPTVMTRHLLDIGDRNRVGEEGFGWITQERDRNDLRRHHARITPKGKAILNQILHAVRASCAALR